MPTRKQLAIELYHTKLKNGSPLIPIGRKTKLTEQEFVKRYLNGVGASTGFKKHELESILAREKERLLMQPPTIKSK